MKIDVSKIVENYLYEEDWRVKENSNSPRSYGGLTKYIVAEVSKNYWLNDVYTANIRRAYLAGDMHIHDLGGLTLYCCGFSLEKILMMGVQGVENIPVSTPAKHFSSALNQIANLLTTYQNEIMGAVALNSMDTLLAPFIAKDKLTKKQVRQDLQNFLFSINSNSRGGAEPAFTNITLDITPPEDMLYRNVIIGGEYQDTVHKDYQAEMDLFNSVFTELMLGGDAKGKPFAYPIITYNIGKRFDWDNPRSNGIFEMAGKFGYPYFSNYINSDMEEGDLRSMCCRLRLDLTELRRKNGGLFGSGDSTGSIGVVTINLPRLGYLSRGKSKEVFFQRLDKVLDVAKESLEMKRVFLQESVLDGGLIPAYKTYVGTLDNHFSTIGDIGRNELCENYLGVNILTAKGWEFALEVGEHIKKRLVEFQTETGNLYNYEATPAESTAYRLAMRDKEEYPDIITQGPWQAPYYTNSCHIPVTSIKGIMHTYQHQEELQCQYTGGTVIHNYLRGPIGYKRAKSLIKTILTEYKVPYTSLSPLNRYCPEHGYVGAYTENCPTCGEPLELYQRITGYLRKVDNFNPGKQAEFADRKQLA